MSVPSLTNHDYFLSSSVLCFHRESFIPLLSLLAISPSIPFLFCCPSFISSKSSLAVPSSLSSFYFIFSPSHHFDSFTYIQTRILTLNPRLCCCWDKSNHSTTPFLTTYNLHSASPFTLFIQLLHLPPQMSSITFNFSLLYHTMILIKNVFYCLSLVLFSFFALSSSVRVIVGSE